MIEILTWINKHKWITFLIVIAIFIMPLLIIHILFSCSTKIDWLIARWTPGDLMSYVAGFEAFIGTVALGALALWQNQLIHNQHIESLEPILSMKLTSANGLLYLIIENKGECEAKEINISIEKIENNGNKDLFQEGLFEDIFELYPHEIVQECIAFCGTDMVTKTFPKVSLKVSYIRPDLNRKREYKRTVIFDGGFKQEMAVDINMNNKKIESDTDNIARAVIRIANYLDGCQVTKMDALNILSKRSLRNDLVSILREEEIIKDSKNVIENGINDTI